MEIKDKMFVAVSYTLYCGDEGEEEEIMEEAPKGQPFKFTFGMGMVLDKFEENLKGKTEGDRFDFYIESKDAYGDYEEGRIVALDKKIFMDEDGNIDSERIFEGNIVPMMDAEGRRMNGVITEIGNEKITMDFNHPLAGERLHFVGEVLEVRPATELEIDLASGKRGCGGCGGGGCHGGEGGCDGDCGKCHGEEGEGKHHKGGCKGHGKCHK